METRKSNLINGRSDVCTRVKLQNPELLQIYGTKVPDAGFWANVARNTLPYSKDL